MTKQILAVLREGYEGPHEASSYFLDSEGGLRQTLEGLSAEEASRTWGGTSIAAHAHHVRFSLEASAASIAGDRSPRDWNQSWSIGKVDAAEWDALRGGLDAEYAKLSDAIEKNGDEVGGALGVLAHLAYHVGAIRQKVAASR